MFYENFNIFTNNIINVQAAKVLKYFKIIILIKICNLIVFETLDKRKDCNQGSNLGKRMFQVSTLITILYIVKPWV
jgi:hypothetical protein